MGSKFRPEPCSSWRSAEFRSARSTRHAWSARGIAPMRGTACVRCGPNCRWRRRISSGPPQVAISPCSALPGFYRPRSGFLEFPQLDQLLRRRSDAWNAGETRRLRFAERQHDRPSSSPRSTYPPANWCASATTRPRTEPTRPRSVRATCWRAAACRRHFPATPIGAATFWDGGIVDNTPLGDAIDAFSGRTTSIVS